MGGFYSHPFFENLYEILKNFSYYISKVNDLPSGRKEKNRGWADRFTMKKAMYVLLFQGTANTKFQKLGKYLMQTHSCFCRTMPPWEKITLHKIS